MKTVHHVPTINANDEFVVVVRWHVADRARVTKGAPLVDVETTKAVVTIEAEHDGWLRHCVKENTEVGLGAELAWYCLAENELDETGAQKALPEVEVPSTTPTPVVRNDPPAAGALTEFSCTRLTPGAEKLALALGLDATALAAEKLGLVTSTGLRARLGPQEAISASVPTDDGRRRERDVPGKRAEIQALSEGAEGNLRSSLTVYFDSADIRRGAEEDGTGVLPVVLAELAPLLAGNPRFTAYHEAGRTVFYDAVHLGVAIDLGQGLKVVTLRDAVGKNAADLGRRLADLTLDYMENRLGPAEVQGATFTVTDLSAFDVLQFEPLINGRQSAILGLGGDSTLPGHPMSLTIAFDHRVLSGREVGAFLRTLRDRILSCAPGKRTEAAAPAPCCDRCLIDLPSYYEKFGAVAVMHNYTRADGGAGLICHSCLAIF